MLEKQTNKRPDTTTTYQIINNTMQDDRTLMPEDRVWITRVSDAVENRLKAFGPSRDFNLQTITEEVGLDLHSLHKEGALMYALWVALLSVLRKKLKKNDYKYQTLEDFLAAYPGQFDTESDTEKILLWQTANWMSILFQMITARKNKGLAMMIIPKLVEGWDAKYVTGSGQTKATANRVQIFEHEGNVRANHRGKGKQVVPSTKGDVPIVPKKKPLTPKSKAVKFNHLMWKKNLLKRKRSDDLYVVSTDSIPGFDTDKGSVTSTDEDDCDRKGVQMSNPYIINNSFRPPTIVYAATGFNMSGPVLVTDPAYATLGPPMPLHYPVNENFLDPLNFISIGGPSELQREYSWTEIPVNGSNTSSDSGSSEDNDCNDPLISVKTNSKKKSVPVFTSGTSDGVLNSQSVQDIFAGY